MAITVTVWVTMPFAAATTEKESQGATYFGTPSIPPPSQLPWEGRFLLPGSDRRPADELIPYWAGGQDAALDVTVINPLQTATLAGAAANPGSALSVAYERKMTSAGELCRRQGLAFIPLAAESLGAWHEVAVGERRKLGAALGRQPGQDQSEATSWLF